MTGHVIERARRTVGAGLLVLAPLACDAGQGADRAEGTGAPEPSRTAAARQDSPAGQARQQAAGTTTLRVDGIEIEVEVADEPAERRRGLMHRDSLPEDHGMLFVYPGEQILSFWMRDTRIPLDIAFLDRQGYIVGIQQMEPQSDRMHESRRPAMYALEMRQGWFEDHGITEGDRVRF